MKLVILDNVRSAHNVGSIFRTADAAGVSKIYLVGTTPTPIDRFGRPNTRIEKTALGATQAVAWEHIGAADSRSTEAALALIASLQQEQTCVIAVEQTDQSHSLSDFIPPTSVAYIFGAEVEGVQPELCAAADQCLEIPMLGMKESLNVGVAAGIVLYA